MKRYLPDPDEYTVRLVDMPVTQGGMISESPDGHINIYINARLSREGQMDAAEHEFKHWLDDDLHNGKSIHDVERTPNRKYPLMMACDLPRKYKMDRPQMDELKDDILLKLPFFD